MVLMMKNLKDFWSKLGMLQITKLSADSFCLIMMGNPECNTYLVLKTKKRYILARFLLTGQAELYYPKLMSLLFVAFPGFEF